MREEEIDWCVYRVIADGDAVTLVDVVHCTGYDPHVVGSSVNRLERAGLLRRSGELLTILTFQELLLCCGLRNDENSPVFIENGVVRVKKDRENTI